MKLKEVCNITGLTKRTIRFYEEKQLISPQGEWKNGRVYRSYSDEDVKILQEIAVLRRAMFTIEEIRALHNEICRTRIFCAIRNSEEFPIAQKAHSFLRRFIAGFSLYAAAVPAETAF